MLVSGRVGSSFVLLLPTYGVLLRGAMNLPQTGSLTVPQDRILVVDDEPLVRSLLSEYLCNEGYECDLAATGRDALTKLATGSFSLVVADIRMPELNGLQLLEGIAQRFPDVATIIVTAIADIDTAIYAMKQGAYDYIIKPFNLEQVAESVKRALQLRRTRLESKRISQNLEALVRKKAFALSTALHDLKDQHKTTLEVLIKALDARGHETQCHSQRVQAYTLRLAQQFDFDTLQLMDLARGALLHDIGKIGVPDGILLKPGKLTQDEWSYIRKHPTIGHEILQGVKFLDRVAWMVLCHHEKWDGTGYPQGLKGEQIPLEARIFAILDAYDAITSTRPYREAMSSDVARTAIIANAGTQFDEKVVEEFLKVPQSDWDEISQKFPG
ncbi:MAG: response regulator [Acidobacteria bacterium]|nr:MAG: response regulator [Acidobacteriota bacterium]